MNSNSGYSNRIEPRLQLVAWEITRKCNLRCAHCRASSENTDYEEELSLQECYRLIDDISSIGKPILILSGGEPLARSDVFDIGKYGVSKGLRVVMGTNGTLVNPEVAGKLADVPISRLAISLDFPDEERQDAFRGEPGAFKQALEGIKNARDAGLEIQINSTITKMNAHLLGDLLELALDLNAASFHPFLLVPTGRGKDLSDEELTPEEYEKTLNWIYDKQQEVGDRIFFKPTDVPHFMRVMSQRQKENPQGITTSTHSPVHHSGHPGMNTISRGCLAGTGFCFISHRGIVQGCGYLTIEAGNVRKQSFSEIWDESPVFEKLRDLGNIKGKCGRCEYKRICGGCRARAFESTGDYLEEEPYCVYIPQISK